TEVAAINPPIQHRSRRDHVEQKEHREKQNAEFADPQFIPREIEPLARNVEAHDVEKRQRDEDQKTSELDDAAISVISGLLYRRRFRRFENRLAVRAYGSRFDR